MLFIMHATNVNWQFVNVQRVIVIVFTLGTGTKGKGTKDTGDRAGCDMSNNFMSVFSPFSTIFLLVSCFLFLSVK